jgi:hypothetical protein
MIAETEIFGGNTPKRYFRESQDFIQTKTFETKVRTDSGMYASSYINCLTYTAYTSLLLVHWYTTKDLGADLTMRVLCQKRFTN